MNRPDNPLHRLSFKSAEFPFLLLCVLRDRMRISSENNGAYGRPGASFEPVGAVQHQQVANGRRSMRAMELLSDSVIERRRNAPT